jgi:FixJ family two-component response regulator
MAESTPVIHIVDDDEGVRQALSSLFRSVGLGTVTFGSAREFLNARLADAPSCLVLDVRLPGLSGLDLQQELADRDIQIPIIFITGHADVPMSVQAMKAGAVEFLTKPVRDQDLLDAVHSAVDRDRVARQHRSETAVLRAKYDSLTPREREVMRLVATGMLNKQIAAELGTSEVTVKLQRGRMMHKMGAPSVADLVRMVDRLGAIETSKRTA